MPEFFQAGAQYVQNEPYWAPEVLPLFRCEHVAPRPYTTDLVAFGFIKSAAPTDTNWQPAVFDRNQWLLGWLSHKENS